VKLKKLFHHQKIKQDFVISHLKENTPLKVGRRLYQ